MNITNLKNVISIRKFKLFLSIAFLIPIVLAYTTNIYEIYSYKISNHYYASFLFFIYLLIMLYWELKRPYFVQYIDEGDLIIFKFYSLLIIRRRYIKIEIPKKSLKSFKIKKFFFNRFEAIILSRKTSQGIIDYPPINLTAVSEFDKIKIKNSLIEIEKRNSKA